MVRGVYEMVKSMAEILGIHWLFYYLLLFFSGLS